MKAVSVSKWLQSTKSYGVSLLDCALFSLFLFLYCLVHPIVLALNLEAVQLAATRAQTSLLAQWNALQQADFDAVLLQTQARVSAHAKVALEHAKVHADRVYHLGTKSVPFKLKPNQPSSCKASPFGPTFRGPNASFLPFFCWLRDRPRVAPERHRPSAGAAGVSVGSRA